MAVTQGSVLVLSPILVSIVKTQVSCTQSGADQRDGVTAVLYMLASHASEDYSAVVT